MGRSKKLEKISRANNIKTTGEYVYNLISYRWIEIWNQFWGVFFEKCLKMAVEKPDFLLFSIFDYLSPNLRHLKFKNVKLNLKFTIRDLILA